MLPYSPFSDAILEYLLQSASYDRGYSGVKLDRRSILGTAKSIYVGGTLLSILLSLALYLSGRRETAIFVGLWAPTILDLGQSIVEEE